MEVNAADVQIYEAAQERYGPIEELPKEKGEAVFQQAMAASKHDETRGVAWRYNGICYSICVAEFVLAKDPANLFGYRRLDFDKDVQYDELSSEESRVDTSKTAKAS